MVRQSFIVWQWDLKIRYKYYRELSQFTLALLVSLIHLTSSRSLIGLTGSYSQIHLGRLHSLIRLASSHSLIRLTSSYSHIHLVRLSSLIRLTSSHSLIRLASSHTLYAFHSSAYPRLILFIFPRILLSVAVLMFLLSSTSSFPEDSPHIFTILKKVSFEE